MGAGSWKYITLCINSSSHYQFILFLTKLKLNVEVKDFTVTNLHFPSSSIQLFYFSSFSLISLAIGLSKILSSSLGFS